MKYLQTVPETMMCKSLTKIAGAATQLAMCALLPLAAGVAAAHHSFSMFDLKKETAITGTIAEFQFTNPHTFIELDVPQTDGSSKRYTIEGPSPSILKRLGWNRSSLKPGDKAKFIVLPLRSGAYGGMLHRATLANGKELSAGNEGTLDKE